MRAAVLTCFRAQKRHLGDTVLRSGLFGVVGMNAENRCINFIYYCFIFSATRKRDGTDKYRSDLIYKNIISMVFEKKVRAVYDLIYRYLIYIRESPISSSQSRVSFESTCHYLFVGCNPLLQLSPVTKKHDTQTLYSLNVDLERFDYFIKTRLPMSSVGEITYPDGIYAPNLSRDDVEEFIKVVISFFSRILEKESYPVKGAFEHIPSIDTLSVIAINLMKVSENDINTMLLQSNSIADVFFMLHGEDLLLSQNNRLVGSMLQVLVDSIVVSAIHDEPAKQARKNAIRVIIFGAEHVSLTTVDAALSSKLENLVYSDEHTLEYLSKTVFSSFISHWWFSELLASAKGKQERFVYLKAVLNSLAMTPKQIDELLRKISSANSTKKSKEKRQNEEVKQLTFDVTPAVREQFERLYKERRKLKNKLTRRQLITEIIEIEYARTCNDSMRKGGRSGIVFDKERDMYYPASVVSPEQTIEKNTKKSKSKFARRYPNKKK